MTCSGVGDGPEIVLTHTLFYTYPEGAVALLSKHYGFMFLVSKKKTQVYLATHKACSQCCIMPLLLLKSGREERKAVTCPAAGSLIQAYLCHHIM